MAEEKEQSDPMTIGLYVNLRKPGIAEIVMPFLEWLHERKIRVMLREHAHRSLGLSGNAAEPVSDPDFVERCDAAVAMGGDGTMLSLAHLIGRSQKPIVGVNLGGLGFLAEVSIDDLYPKMEELAAGRYTTQNRMILETSVPRQGGADSLFAMNDAVIYRGSSPRVLKIKALVDGIYFNTYIADGIIVSTPTGSTAYSLAASGPIVVPSVESIILNPICPHTLTARPTVIPASSVITLEVESSEFEAQLSVDGQTNNKLTSGAQITVKRACYDMRLIVFKDHDFFELLRKKLQWGSLPRK
jgi:NAD+ kinase